MRTPLDELLRGLITDLARVDAMAIVIDDQLSNGGRDASGVVEASVHSIRTWSTEAIGKIEAFMAASNKAVRRG